MVWWHDVQNKFYDHSLGERNVGQEKLLLCCELEHLLTKSLNYKMSILE